MFRARTLRARTVAVVVTWKLVALTMLPAALCCRAMMVAEGAAMHACCPGGEHGAACPMKRGDRTEHADAASAQPRMIGCPSLDDALLGLLNLAGFTLHAFEWTVSPVMLGSVAEARYAAVSFAGSPSPPPPRA